MRKEFVAGLFNLFVISVQHVAHQNRAGRRRVKLIVDIHIVLDDMPKNGFQIGHPNLRITVRIQYVMKSLNDLDAIVAVIVFEIV